MEVAFTSFERPVILRILVENVALMTLLFVIFGWPTKTKEYGATYPTECPHCSNDNYLHLLKSRKWFTLYFIPLIPLGRGSFDLVCPTCNASIRLDNRAEIKQAKELNSTAEAYHNDEIPVEEFQRELTAFETDVFANPDGPERVDSQTYEGASGSIIRTLCALLFAFAVFTTVFGIAELNPAALVYALGALPYLAIRYRDPASTTIPLAGYVEGRI